MDWLLESVATLSLPCARQWTRSSAPDDNMVDNNAPVQAVAPIIANGAGCVYGQDASVDVPVKDEAVGARRDGAQRRIRWRLVLTT